MRPSLHRHYPASSVLLRNPTPYILFGFLILDLSAILLKERLQGLPSSHDVFMCSMPRPSTPGCWAALAYSAQFSVVFCSSHCIDHSHWEFRGSTSSAFTFGLLPLLPTLSLNVTASDPRLDTGGWLGLSRREFHPLYTVRFLAHGTVLLTQVFFLLFLD